MIFGRARSYDDSDDDDDMSAMGDVEEAMILDLHNDRDEDCSRMDLVKDDDSVTESMAEACSDHSDADAMDESRDSEDETNAMVDVLGSHRCLSRILPVHLHCYRDSENTR